MLCSRSRHIGAALGVFVVLAENSGGWKTPVDITYNEWSRTEDDNFRILQRSERLTRSFYPGFVLLLCSVVSGLHHVVAAVDAGYFTTVLGGFGGYRWIDYGVSAPLMLVVNEVLWLAPPDVNTLVLVASVQLLIVVGGGAAPEWWWAMGTAPPGWSVRPWVVAAFSASTLPFVWIWLRYVWILDLGSRAGDEEVPDFVKIVLALLASSFAAFPIVFAAKVLGPRDEARNVRFEGRFMLLSALAKIPLLAFFATGIVSRRTRVSADTDESIPSDDDSRRRAHRGRCRRWGGGSGHQRCICIRRRPGRAPLPVAPLGMATYRKGHTGAGR